MNMLKQLAADLMQQEQPQQPQGSWGDMTTYPYGENSKSTSNLAQILAGKEVNRGTFAPLVEYGDGRIEYGVPNALMAPARAVTKMLTPGYDYSNTQQAAQDSFDAAGLISTGGLAGAGMRPRGSIGMGGGGIKAGPKFDFYESGSDWIVKTSDDLGGVGGSISPDGQTFNIGSSWLDDGLRGTGVGAAAYARIIDEALSRKMTVTSDQQVSASAARVYNSLKNKGYDVRMNENAVQMDGGGFSVPPTSKQRHVFSVHRK